MADSRTFTCFPKLPLEIRIKIWEEAANLPRNLDIWAHTTGKATSFRRSNRDREVVDEYTMFKFTTRQPVPGVLLASKESRAASRKFFHLSFGSDLDYGSGLEVITHPEILRNFEADRICPMGPYTEDSSTWMWCAEPPPSCAVNIYHTSTMRPDPLDQLLFQANGFHDEILLYYCEKLVKISGPFDFVDISDGYATFRAWKALSEAKDRLTRTFDAGVVRPMADIVRRHEEEDLEPPTEEEIDIGWDMPEIKFVALVVQGVRY